MKDTTKTRLRIWAIFAAVTLTVCVILAAANRINRSSDLDERSLALGSTMHFVTVYLDANDGQWPASWEDLDGLTDPEHPEGVPFDAALAKEWVKVDFSATPSAILEKLPENFDAITPSGEIKDGYVDQVYSKLIAALKRYHAEAEEAEPAEPSTP